MIWYWLKMVLWRVVWFFRTPDLQDISKISKDVPCPVCGNRDGRLRCVQRPTKPATEDGTYALGSFEILCQHTCNECGAEWFEKPVIKSVTSKTVLPSVARNELESSDDVRNRNR